MSRLKRQLFVKYIGTLFYGMREFKYFSNQKTIDNIVVYDLALRTFLSVLQNH